MNNAIKNRENEKSKAGLGTSLNGHNGTDWVYHLTICAINVSTQDHHSKRQCSLYISPLVVIPLNHSIF